MSRDQFVNTNRNTKFSVDFNDSLLTKLKDKEDELKTAIENNNPETTKIIQELDIISKELKTSFEKFNIDTNQNSDLPRNKNEYYQYRLNKPDQFDDSDEEVSISEIDNEQNETIKFSKKISLKPSTLTTNAESSCIGTSTPVSRGLVPTNNITSIFGSLGIQETPINNNTIDNIKKQLSIEIKPEVIEAYFADQNNAAEIDKTIKSPGFGFFQAIKLVRDRLTTFTAGAIVPHIENIKIETSPSHRDSTDRSELFLSFDKSLNALKIESPRNKARTEQKTRKMAETIQVRGMSISNVLDLIPRFNGQNVSLSLFLDGCREAKELLPSTLEGELAKFIRMRLYGDALKSTRGQTFTSVNDVIEFFENIYGSAKTYHDWSGDLAKMKQKSNESVIVFLNRIREIEKEIIAAAQREGRITNKQAFLADLEKDCIKFFKRGLRWEIRGRMGTPTTLKEAREQAIEIEREYAGCAIDDDELPDAKLKSRDTRRVHLVDFDQNAMKCGFCGRVGHVTINCRQLALQHLQRPSDTRDYQRDRGPPTRGNQNFRNDTRSNNTNFGGWNAENRQRNGFFPNQSNNNYNNNSNFNRRISENPRSSNDENPRPPNNPNYNRNNTSNNSNAFRPTCYYCGIKGHTRNACFKLQRDMRSGNVAQGNAESLSQEGARREMTSGTRPTDSNERDTLTSVPKQ